ncbi:Na(+)-translocating NADH-quinone reductase subunit F, partial [Haemophilus influenzae]
AEKFFLQNFLTLTNVKQKKDIAWLAKLM